MIRGTNCDKCFDIRTIYIMQRYIEKSSGAEFLFCPKCEKGIDHEEFKKENGTDRK